MNTPDHTLADNEAFSIAELEARFEMQAVPVGTLNPVSPDWECSCSFKN
jgi:hypothetical protein